MKFIVREIIDHVVEVDASEKAVAWQMARVDETSLNAAGKVVATMVVADRMLNNSRHKYCSQILSSVVIKRSAKAV